MSSWILKVSGASMPASCRSQYSKVRVLEVADGVTDVPTVRSKSVIRVVYESRAVPSRGLTDRSGLQRALGYARGLIAEHDAAREALVIANRRKCAELAQRDQEISLETRTAMQDLIVAKLQRGEPLTDSEFASLK
jgi:hypothetical protein